MKKDTKQQRANIVNNTLFYFYKNIEIDISLDDLAEINSMSKYHFHRVFKEETGQKPFEVLTSIRLQKAANLLIVNKYSTISQIANACGYSSHSSFIKAFKKKFNSSPKEWKNTSHKKFSQSLIDKFPRNKKIEFLEPRIQMVDGFKCLYIRHKGYIPSIKSTWQKIQAIAYELELNKNPHIAIHHDNPTLTELEEASYVAALEVDKNHDNKKFSQLEFPKSLCAIFSFKGEYGDLLNLMRYVYHYWLPNSGYEAKTLPSYSRYRKNHFLDENEVFDLDFYLPISLIY